jgi:hypothetical protein
MVFPDMVFIDTSLFREENFFAPGNRINTLCQLAKEGKIKLVTTEITIQEVRSKIAQNVREAWKGFEKDCLIFRNHPETDQWRRSTDKKKEIEYVYELFDYFLAESKTKILDYTYCTNAAKVFTDYFEKKKPFGEGKKKDEFPDAFVLTSLEKYAAEIHDIIVVLSKDSDMFEYESEYLEYEDYRRYVSNKVAEGVALDGVLKKLYSEKMFLEPKIKDAVVDYLDDFRLYTTLLNLTEVSYHSIDDVSVDIDEQDYEVLSVNGNVVEFEIQPEVRFKVEVEYVNYDFATYDREDGKWYNTEEETYNVDSETTIRVTLRYSVDSQSKIDYMDIIDMDLTPLSDAIK